MKFIVTLFLLIIAIYQVNKFLNKSDKSLVELSKNLTVQRIVILLSIVWFIFAFIMIEPFSRVDAWDNIVIIALLPVLLINGLLWIIKNHKND